MLSIYFGKIDNSFYGPSWFKVNYEQEWLADSFVGEIIRDVDKSEYKGGNLIVSDVLGPISPRELSGGTQTLICIYSMPGLIFDATSCGQNCAKWLIEIGKRKDVTVMLEYYMSFKEFEPFEIHIKNMDTIVKSGNEYTYAALDLLHKEAENEG